MVQKGTWVGVDRFDREQDAKREVTRRNNKPWIAAKQLFEARFSELWGKWLVGVHEDRRLIYVPRPGESTPRA